MKTGVIYKATSPSGGIYIGQTVNLSRRQRDHKNSSFNEKSKDYNNSFHCAIRKYGWENIEWECLECNIPEDFLCQKEIEYILKYNSFNDRKHYNESSGGKGRRNFKHSEESKQKMSNTRIERGLAKGINNSMYGKHHSDEDKLKIAKSKIGLKHSDELKALWSKKRMGAGNSMFGKKRPDVVERNKKRKNNE